MFIEQIESLSKEKNTTASTVARELGYSMGSLSHWRKGNCPRGDIVARFADYFNVSTDYLLGRTNNPMIATPIDAKKDHAGEGRGGVSGDVINIYEKRNIQVKKFFENPPNEVLKALRLEHGITTIECFAEHLAREKDNLK